MVVCLGDFYSMILSMARVSFCALNARGLNSPVKRTSLLDVLANLNIDIALISETRLARGNIPRLEDKRYRLLSNSSAVNSTKGVLILVRKNLEITILESGGDLEGRMTFVKTILCRRKIAFVAVYAPTPFESDFFPHLTEMLLDLQDFEFVIGGDFNAAYLNSADRTSSLESSEQILSSASLRNWAEQVAVIDLWRTSHPLERDFSFFSGRHGTMHRIDYIFVSRNLFHNIQIDMSSLALSDHKVVVCRASLTAQRNKAPRWRFNNELLQNEEFSVMLDNDLRFFMSFFNRGDDPRIRWHLIKGQIRNSCTSFSTHLNKLRRQKMLDLERQIHSIEQAMLANLTVALLAQRRTVRAELDELLRHKAEFLMHRTREIHYFEGSRPSRALAISLKACENFASIAAIRNSQGVLSDDPKQISENLASFFAKQYESEISYDQNLTDTFLNISSSPVSQPRKRNAWMLQFLCWNWRMP